MGKSLTRGVLVFGRNGKAYVDVPGRRRSVQLAKGCSGTAMHGDEVEIRSSTRQKKKRGQDSKSKRSRYQVVKILSRGVDEFLGYALRAGKTFKIRPEDSRLPVTFELSGKPPPKLKDGDKVLARFQDWNQEKRPPRCRILRNLGRGGNPMTDHLGILAKYKLPSRFPKNVQRTLDSIPEKVRSEDVANRLDLRKRFTLTVDPVDARDFDDALSFHSLKDGKVEVGVHIADVSAYFEPDTPLDKEARRRGNSTYLVGEVVPMLPTKLSNGICSLVEAEDRLAKSVLFTFDSKGKLVGHRLAETVIHSDKRLTYEQASLLMEEESLAKIKAAKPPASRYSGSPGKPLAKLPDSTLRKLQATLRKLWKIAESLRRLRFRQGALDLGSSEVKILVDEKGRVERIQQMENDESHQLIEEFMLLANETVAKDFRRMGKPSLFRVHDDPDPEKLDELRSFAGLFEISCGDLNHRKAMAEFAKSIKDHPLAQVLRIKLLRSLRKACYRASPDGHFGLAKKDYLHFTSPIRRYSDLIVHRILEAHLRGARKTPYSKGRLEGIAKQVSETERNSIDAERESKKTKLVAYYARELKENKPRPHGAVITEITRKGFFVEIIDTLAQGFVTLSVLPRHEAYRVSANGTTIVARNPRNNLKIGQKVKVVIDRIDPDDKFLDFRLA